MAFTYTRTTTHEDNVNPQKTSFPIPSLEELVNQITSHFEKNPEEKISPEEIRDLAKKIHVQFQMLEGRPYLGHFRFTPSAPHLVITAWSDEWTMYDRIRYPGDYSPLAMLGEKYEHISFAIVVVYAGKYITLNYVPSKR